MATLTNTVDVPRFAEGTIGAPYAGLGNVRIVTIFPIETSYQWGDYRSWLRRPRHHVLEGLVQSPRASDVGLPCVD